MSYFREENRITYSFGLLRGSLRGFLRSFLPSSAFSSSSSGSRLFVRERARISDKMLSYSGLSDCDGDCDGRLQKRSAPKGYFKDNRLRRTQSLRRHQQR
jgi:hypothetical protein